MVANLDKNIDLYGKIKHILHAHGDHRFGWARDMLYSDNA